MHLVIHVVFQIALAAAAALLIWLGFNSIRRTRKMQRGEGEVRNLLGLTPWYAYLLPDERLKENTIISHNYMVGAFAVLAGIGAVLILIMELFGPGAVS